MKYWFCVMLLAISCASSADDGAEAEALTRLLHDFLAGASRNDAAAHQLL